MRHCAMAENNALSVYTLGLRIKRGETENMAARRFCAAARKKCGGWQIMKKHGITAVRRIILPEGRGHGLSVQLRAVRNRLYYHHG